MSGRVLFAPFLMRRPGITRIADLRYGDAGRKNLLDVYHGRPKRFCAPGISAAAQRRLPGAGIVSA
jgi:hypothetical protein